MPNTVPNTITLTPEQLERYLSQVREQSYRDGYANATRGKVEVKALERSWRPGGIANTLQKKVRRADWTGRIALKRTDAIRESLSKGKKFSPDLIALHIKAARAHRAAEGQHFEAAKSHAQQLASEGMSNDAIDNAPDVVLHRMLQNHHGVMADRHEETVETHYHRPRSSRVEVKAEHHDDESLRDKQHTTHPSMKAHSLSKALLDGALYVGDPVQDELRAHVGLIPGHLESQDRHALTNIHVKALGWHRFLATTQRSPVDRKNHARAARAHKKAIAHLSESSPIKYPKPVKLPKTPKPYRDTASRKLIKVGTSPFNIATNYKVPDPHVAELLTEHHDKLTRHYAKLKTTVMSGDHQGTALLHSAIIKRRHKMAGLISKHTNYDDPGLHRSAVNEHIYFAKKHGQALAALQKHVKITTPDNLSKYLKAHNEAGDEPHPKRGYDGLLTPDGKYSHNDDDHFSHLHNLRDKLGVENKSVHDALEDGYHHLHEYGGHLYVESHHRHAHAAIDFLKKNANKIKSLSAHLTTFGHEHGGPKERVIDLDKYRTETPGGPTQEDLDTAHKATIDNMHAKIKAHSNQAAMHLKAAAEHKEHLLKGPAAGSGMSVDDHEEHHASQELWHKNTAQYHHDVVHSYKKYLNGLQSAKSPKASSGVEVKALSRSAQTGIHTNRLRAERVSRLK